MLAIYRRLPEEVRRCLRPLNLADEVASCLPGRLRADVAAVSDAVRRVALLRTQRFRLRRLEGHAGGDPLVCLLAMDEGSARYWRRAFFDELPRETDLGEVPALAVPDVARRRAGQADLSLWQIAWPVGRRAGGPFVPAWVPLGIPTARALDAIVTGERSGRDARKNDVRRVLKLGFTTRVTRDTADYESFRTRLFEPYGSQRFGELFVPLPAYTYRHARRHGALLLVEREGRVVAGSLLERWRGTLRILAFGVDPASGVPPGTALAACYYHSIGYAVAEGYPWLSFGTCRPVLTNGVLRYKRKWGGRLGGPLSWDSFLLRYRNTAGVRSALTRTPLVLDYGRGRLGALVGARGDAGRDLDAHLAQLDTPGLASLACLVDPDVEVTPGLTTPHTPLRVVLPGEVWPAPLLAA